MAVSEGSDGPIFDTAPHDDDYGYGNARGRIIRTLASACELYSVKVLGKSLGGKGTIFAGGLRWAIDNGMHVCNLSLSTSKKDFFGTLHELADLAYFRNVMLVAAAKNLPIKGYPGMYASVFSVTSHTIADSHRFYYNPRRRASSARTASTSRWPGAKGNG